MASSFGYIAFFTQRLKIKFTTAQFLYVALIVLSIYVFGLLGFLWQGAMITALIGVVFFAVYLRDLNIKNAFIGLSIKNALTNIIERNWFWNAFYLIPFIIVYRIIPEGFLFTGWDEFSHWALSTKIIYESNSLYLNDSPMTFKHYPPAQELFQYYFLKFAGWSEKNVIFAQGVFVLSSMVCLTGKLFEQTSLLAIATFLAACGILYNFGYDFSHIYVDPLLSSVFATCLILAVSEEKIVGALMLSLCLAVLILIKQIGLILALVVLAVYSAITFARVFRQYFLERDPKAGTDFAKAISYIILAFASIVLTFKSWDWYILKIHAYQTLVFPSISQVFEPPMLQRLGLTIVEFIKRLDTGWFVTICNGAIHLSYNEIAASSHPIAQFYEIITGHFAMIPVSRISFWVTVFSLLAVLFSWKGNRVNHALFLTILAVGCVGYMAFLLLSFLVFFDEYSGVRLASFERYAATYYLAWALILLSMICASADRIRSKIFHVVFSALTLSILMFAPPKFFADLRGVEMPAQEIETRKKVGALAELAKRHLNAGEKAYFISQNSNGFEKYVFNYSMLPYSSQWWCWSVGDKYSKEDVWSCNQKLSDLLKGYSVLVVYSGDDRFWGDNRSLLNESSIAKQTGVYKIVHENGFVKSMIEVY